MTARLLGAALAVALVFGWSGLRAVATASDAAPMAPSPPGAASGRARDPVGAEASLAESLAAEARARAGSVLAVAPLVDLAGLRDWLPADVWEAHVQSVLAVATDPTVRAFAARMAARARAGTGDFDGARAVEAAAGFVAEAAVVGPFQNDGMAAFATPLAPELGPGPYAGRTGEVDWRTVATPPTHNWLLDAWLAPAQAAALYVAFGLEVDADVDGHLLVGSAAAYRVWVDGEPLAEQPEPLGESVGRDWLPLRVAAGQHTVLFKVGTSDGTAGVAVHVDVGAARLTLSVPTSTGVPRQPDAWPAPLGLHARLDAALGETPGADDLAAAAAVARALAPADPQRRWVGYRERAATAGGASSRAVVRLAATTEELWRRVEVLERGLLDTPDDAWLRLALGVARTEQLGQRPVREGFDLLHSLDADPNGPLAASAALAELRYREGFESWPVAHWQATHDRAPWAVSALRALTGGREASHGLADAAVWWRALLQTRRDDPSVYLGAADATAPSEHADWDLGSPGAGAALTAALSAAAGGAASDGGRAFLPPHDLAVAALVDDWALLPAAWTGAAGAWQRLGRHDLVLNATDRALALSPGDASLHERRGRALVSLDRRDEAADAFERALELRPQDTTLRAYANALRSSGAAFYEPYRLDVETILSLAGDRSNPGSASYPYTVLVDQEAVRVFDNGLATRWRQQAYHLHTRSGVAELRDVFLSYTPGDEVVDVRAVRVIRPDGTQNRVFASSERANWGGPAAMYFDVRTRVVTPQTLDPGDVLVVEYTVAQVANRNMFDTYFGDLWFVDDRVPRRLVRYTLLTPPALAETIATTPDDGWTSTEEGTVHVLAYEARDVAPIAQEPASPGAAERYRYLGVSTYRSWDALADWYWNLVRGQLTMSPEIEEVVSSLQRAAPSREALVEAVHAWVVRNIRYVGLEFGIHGFRPYRTTDILGRRFGDCKDTASLIKAMLDHAGIPTHLVLIRTSDLGRVRDYPPSLALFNHAIAYVPEFDMYLDGTAAFSGARELPTADQGASAVIVRDGHGGDFVTTPVLPAAASTSRSVVAVDMRSPDRPATGQWLLSGAFAPGARSAYENADARATRLQNELAAEASGIALVDASFGGVDDVTRDVEVSWHSRGGDWGALQGDTFVVRPFGLFGSLTSGYASLAERTTVLELPHTYRLAASYSYTFERGAEVLDLPAAVQRSTPFGSLSATVRFDQGVLVGEAELVIDTRRVDPGDYAAFRAFAVEVDAALGRTVRVRNP